MDFQSSIESVPVALRIAPSDFGQRTDARKGLVLYISRRLGIARSICLAEKRSLESENISPLLLCKAMCGRRERVYLAAVEYRSPVVPRLARRLLHIEIEIGAGHDHRRITVGRSFQTLLDTLPAVYVRRSGETSAVDRLVPDRRMLAVRQQDALDARHEIRLQRMGIAAAPLYICAACRTASPLRHVDLVAAYMYMFRREQSAYLAENILQQPVVALIGRT